MNGVVTYRLIYLVAAIIIILFSYTTIHITVNGVNRDNKRMAAFFIIAVLIGVFAACRPYDIQDTLAYFDVYEKTGTPDVYLRDLWIIGNRTYNLETGFVFIMSLCKQLSMSFKTFLFVIAFLNTFITCNMLYSISQLSKQGKGGLFVRELSNDGESILVAEKERKPLITKHIISAFLAFFGLHYCCIAIRAGLSIALCFISLFFALRDKKIASLIFLYCAFRMHSIAFLFIVVLVFIFLQQSRRISVKISDINAIRICVVICLLSLFLNLGSIIIDGVVRNIKHILNNYGIAGFGGYLVGIDKQVGLKDWLTVGVIGTYLVVCRDNTLNAMTKLIILGLFITSFLYPIRAINRAADYYYCLLLPTYIIYKDNGIKKSIFIEYLLLPLLLGVQLAFTI